MEISNNQSLESISFPLLESVNQNFNVSRNPSLTTVDLSSIQDFDRVLRISEASSFFSENNVGAIIGQLESITPAITGKEITLPNVPIGPGASEKLRILRENGNFVNFSNSL